MYLFTLQNICVTFWKKSYQCLLIVFISFSFIKWYVPFSARISFRRLQTTDVPTLVAADL